MRERERPSCLNRRVCTDATLECAGLSRKKLCPFVQTPQPFASLGPAPIVQEHLYIAVWNSCNIQIGHKKNASFCVSTAPLRDIRSLIVKNITVVRLGTQSASCISHESFCSSISVSKHVTYHQNLHSHVFL